MIIASRTARPKNAPDPREMLYRHHNDTRMMSLTQQLYPRAVMTSLHGPSEQNVAEFFAVSVLGLAHLPGVVIVGLDPLEQLV